MFYDYNYCMKIYLAYRFHGEDFTTLKQELDEIADDLSATGHQAYHSVSREEYFQKNNFTKKQIFKYSLDKLKKSDALLAYIKSPEKSEGMLLEIGFALALNKPVYVIIKKGIKTNFVTEIAQKVIKYNKLSNLKKSLATLS